MIIQDNYSCIEIDTGTNFLSKDKKKDTSPPLMWQEAKQSALCVQSQILNHASAFKKVAEKLRDLNPHILVTCGRGSSDHAATYIRYLAEIHLGILTSSNSPSISSIYDVKQNMEGCCFLVISQSGRSPDLLSAARSAKATGAYVVAMVNDVESPLAKVADDVLPICAGVESSVAATKSYICSLAAGLHLIAHWTQKEWLKNILIDLPNELRNGWTYDWTPLLDSLKSAEHLAILGRGVGLAIAQEAALKFKETCGLHAEAFSSAEFSHGPKAILQNKMPVLIINQEDETKQSTKNTALELLHIGANLLIAGGEVPGVIHLPYSKVNSTIAPILLVQNIYQIAAMLAIYKGLNPDQPPLLRKVTETM
jgi:glucosamine--fructose-6-phosphate aminotransferase (isomerizing)